MSSSGCGASQGGADGKSDRLRSSDRFPAGLGIDSRSRKRKFRRRPRFRPNRSPSGPAPGAPQGTGTLEFPGLAVAVGFLLRAELSHTARSGPWRQPTREFPKTLDAGSEVRTLALGPQSVARFVHVAE